MIKRPILAMVIAIIIVIMGAIALKGLPVEQYPNITPPVVEVTATYPGANATQLSQSVTTPLSEAIMGVEGMSYMQSTSANNGQMTITIVFEEGTEPNTNTILTQNKVNSTLSLLPESVQEQGVDISKSQSGFLLVYSLMGDENYTQNFLSNYALINMEDNLLKIAGVGKVQVMGAGEYAMRVWLKPDKMAYYNLSIEEITSQIESQSGIFSSGSLGAEPLDNPTQFTYSVMLPAEISTPQQYKDIVLVSNDNGSEVLLSDVATVEFGSLSYGLNSLYNEKNCAIIAIYQEVGSNAFEVGESVKSAMEEMSENFPEGISYSNIIDTTTVISEGTKEIIYTLLIALLLVVIIIYLFVQDFRAMIIPLVAIPVSLIGAFILFPLLGFTINVFSLLGLVLAIGLVVDDAIVVVEAVQVGLEKRLTPKDATIEAMGFVRSPIIATTLVLAAVFVPVAIMGGITGVMYRQFAITIAVSLLISALNALSLSPVLCTIWLRDKNFKTTGFFGWFNRNFHNFVESYLTLTSKMSRRWGWPIAFVAIALLGAIFLLNRVPIGFLPQEDQGYLMTNISLPPASSLAQTKKVVAQASNIAKSNPNIESIGSLAGFDILSNVATTNSALLFLNLTDTKRQSATAIAQEINGAMYEEISGGECYTFGPPSIPGIGTASGFSMMLQQRGTPNPQDLEKELDKFLAAANKRPEIAKAYSMFTASVPARKIEINRARAMSEGVSMSTIHSAISTLLGGTYIGNMNRFGKLYQTYIEAAAEYRRDEKSLQTFYVANGEGEQIPLSEFITLTDTSNVEYLTGFNLLNSATVMGNSAMGYSSNDAIAALEEVAKETLPSNMKYSWSGMSYQEINGSSSIGITLLISLIFIYLVLAALYESWTLPLTIIVGIPFAMLGAVGALYLANQLNSDYTNNIFFQVSMIMLVALSAKNAILIIEYAEKLYVEGASLLDAAVGAAKLRIRPIIMTALAFILGVSPLIFANGSNAIARNIMGVSLVGGMVVTTLFGLIVYPALYVVVGKLGNFEKRRQKMKEEIE